MSPAQWRERFDRILPVIIVGLMILLTVSAVLSVAVLRTARTANRNTERIEGDQARLNVAIRGSCSRLQRARDDVNLNWWNDRLNSLQSARDSAAVAAILGRFGAQNPLLLRLATPFEESAAAFRQRAASAQYLPPTDCDEAVRHPGSYRSPSAVPFALVLGCYDPSGHSRPTVPCRRPARSSGG